MRRASQRHSLVTLNELNITPLLDLAFVLLIIFIITRPALEQSIQLDLPSGGAAEGKLNPEDIARVEITAQGEFYLNRQRLSLPQIEQALVAMNRANPRMVVHLAGDRSTFWENGVKVIDICKQHDITRFNIRMKE
ncbi:MAG TPA: biopolymer transporter ExbD [Verrucomicrobiae bacterium]|nr:biopolymer transporter ExbD [Verrucomicrobiae bacterium]